MKLFSLLPCLGLTLVPSSLLPAQTPSPNPAVMAASKNPWMEKHDRLCSEARSKKPAILFIGDSITEGWTSKGRGLDVWTEKYEPLGAFNMGIGGDRTENVLWRLQNGALKDIDPRLVVLLIGINNNGRGDTAPQIAEGVQAVLAEIRKQLPEAKVLLLGIFPINPEVDSPARAKVKEVNKIIAGSADGKTVFFLDIGDAFLQPDGTISNAIMTDFVHLSPKGYQIWADAMNAVFTQLAPSNP